MNKIEKDEVDPVRAAQFFYLNSLDEDMAENHRLCEAFDFSSEWLGKSKNIRRMFVNSELEEKIQQRRSKIAAIENENLRDLCARLLLEGYFVCFTSTDAKSIQPVENTQEDVPVASTVPYVNSVKSSVV